jgi:hypothetical protein
MVQVDPDQPLDGLIMTERRDDLRYFVPYFLTAPLLKAEESVQAVGQAEHRTAGMGTETIDRTAHFRDVEPNVRCRNSRVDKE